MTKIRFYFVLITVFFNISCSKTIFSDSLEKFKRVESTHEISVKKLKSLLVNYIDDGSKKNKIIHVITNKDSTILFSRINFDAYTKADKNKLKGYINNYEIPIMISGEKVDLFFKRKGKIEIHNVLKPQKIDRLTPPIIYEPRYEEYKLTSTNKLKYLGKRR